MVCVKNCSKGINLITNLLGFFNLFKNDSQSPKIFSILCTPIQMLAKHFFSRGGFDPQFTNFIKVHSANTSGKVVASLKTTHPKSASYMTALVDEINAYSLIPRFVNLNYFQNLKNPAKFLGVSVSLDVNMADSNSESSELLMVTEIIDKTETMVYLSCKIYDKATNTLIAQGTHAKYIGF